MIRALFVLLVLLTVAAPAQAHSLRLFARSDGAQVSGYGFFIGGGRPQGAAWRAEMAGATVASGTTDAEGGFAFAAPQAASAPLTITLDTGDGHIVRTTLGAERLGALPDATPATPAPAPPEATARLVEEAVARQIAPLSEQLAAMETRTRLTDVVAALSLIFGIAGIALWARGRRK